MFLKLIVFILIIVPISLFIHELGHLLGAKHLKADRVTVSIGIGKELYSFVYKNLHFNIYMFIMFQAYTDSERNPRFTDKEYAFITLMGPIFSLILTGVSGVLLIKITSEVLTYFFFFNLWLSVVNLIPFKIKNQKSDGYLIWDLLK